MNLIKIYAVELKHWSNRLQEKFRSKRNSWPLYQYGINDQWGHWEID